MGILKKQFFSFMETTDAIHICLNYTEMREPLSVDHSMQHSLIGQI